MSPSQLQTQTRSTLTVRAPAGFDLRRAVCSYGYFVLAPNHWDPSRGTLTRPLWCRQDRPVTVTISQTAGALVIQCDTTIARDGQAAIKTQVRRMLRMDEDLSGWFRRHPRARRLRFGRPVRSPTLFEDIVKTMTGCNVTWPNTMTMNRRLCSRIGGGHFPTHRQLARTTPARLKVACRVGYRAERIVRLARSIDRGRLDLDWFERPERTSDEIYDGLRKIHGVGDYAAANLCQSLGHYDRLAVDTETYRHFCQTRRLRRPKDPRRLRSKIEAHYERFAPYQFLAYWFEIWQSYERIVGRPSHHWRPEDGRGFTAAKLGKE